MDKSSEWGFYRPPIAGFAMPHVSGLHHLVQDKTAGSLIRWHQQEINRQSEHVSENPHQPAHETIQPKPLYPINGFHLFIFGKSLFQHIVVIHHLPQTNAIPAVVTEAMQQDKHPVESQTRHGRTHHWPVQRTELLEAAIVYRIVHVTWPDMGFKMHILKEVEMYVVVCHTMQLALFIEVTCEIIIVGTRLNSCRAPTVTCNSSKNSTCCLLDGILDGIDNISHLILADARP